MLSALFINFKIFVTKIICFEIEFNIIMFNVKFSFWLKTIFFVPNKYKYKLSIIQLHQHVIKHYDL